jgi:hypothetical protein
MEGVIWSESALVDVAEVNIRTASLERANRMEVSALRQPKKPVPQCIHRISLEEAGLIAQDSNCLKELTAHLAAPQALLQKPVLDWILEESNRADAED